jgi:hypothetical protein
MGVGFKANSAYVIDEDKLKELNLPSFEQFQELLQKVTDGELQELDSYDWVHGHVTYKELDDLWKPVQEEFKEATGLELNVGYHDYSDGDTYDEVDGIYYFAAGVVSPTLAGAKALESGLVEKKWWVTFG